LIYILHQCYSAGYSEPTHACVTDHLPTGYATEM